MSNMSLNKLVIVLKGGPPEHKDGSTGVGSGNYERAINLMREYYPRDDSGNVDYTDTTPSMFYFDHRDAFLSSITPNQKEALEDYSGVYHQDINALLRTKQPSAFMSTMEPEELAATKKKTRWMIKNLYESMKPLDEAMIVYRGTSGVVMPAVGTTFRDKGFVSTSMDARIAAPFATMFSIRIPKGTKVAYGTYNSYDEYEIILPPNSKFKVLGSRRLDMKPFPRMNPNHTPFIHELELVPSAR